MSLFKDAKEIKKEWGLDRTHLRRLVEMGEVGFVKLGESKQSGIVYNASDIEKYFERNAVRRTTIEVCDG